MGKTLLLALLCGVTGSAVTTAIGTTIYSSPFQCSYPIGGSIKTVLDPANIWSATVSPAPGQDHADLLVDSNGDLQMDTIHPECAS